MISQKRNLSVDLIKAICIILVVIGHIIVAVYPESHNTNLVFKICYSFHMPLFIFVGGGVTAYKSVEKLAQKQWIFTRFKRLMIPYIIWSVIVETISGKYDVFNYLFSVPRYWYLINLFVSDLVLFVSAKTKKLMFVTMGLLYCVFVFGYVAFKDSNVVIKNIVMFFPFYAIGYVCFRYKDSAIFARIKKYGWIALILYPVSMALYSYKEYDLWIARIHSLLHIESFSRIIHAGLLFYNHYIVATLGICFIWYAVEKLVMVDRLKSVVNTLTYVGKYTIFIYILEWIPGYILPDSLYRAYLLNEFAVFIITMSIPLLVAKAVSYVPMVSKMLFGQ